MTAGGQVVGDSRVRVRGVLGKALSLLRRRFGPIVLLALLFGYLPSAFFGVALLGYGLSQGEWRQQTGLEAWTVFIFNIPLVLGVTHIGLADMTGRSAGFVEALRVAWTRLVGGGWVMVVAWVGVSLASLMFVIPGVVAALMWMVAVPLKLAEGGPATQVLTRSSEMTAGARWRLLGLLLLTLAMILATYLAWYFGLQAALYAVSEGWTLLLSYLVLDPLFTAFVLVLGALIPVAVFDALGGASRILPAEQIVD